MRAGVAASLVLLVGCSPPGEGEACAPHQSVCVTSDEALVCTDGRMTRFACRGPGGCYAELMRGGVCDQTVAAEGDLCRHGGSACSADAVHFLECKDGRYSTLSACRGPDACHIRQERVLCDDSVAVVGERCGETMSTCAADREAWVRCREGRVYVHASCRGPAGCRTEGDQLFCDRTVGRAGDPCEREGVATCGEDRRSLLVCTDGQFTFRANCLGEEGCRSANGRVQCRTAGTR